VSREQVLDQHRDPVQQVLGVVQHEQRGHGGRAERGPHGRRDAVGVAQPGQLHQHRTAGPVRGHGEGQPGLAGAARPGQRDQPVAAEPVGDQRPLGLPADEAGQRHRQPGAGALRAQHGQVGRAQLG
jgi:hypothetical protein